MNVILFGYRGSGKTTLGRLLAHEIWKQFVDTDEKCVERLGVGSVAEAWEKLGEPAWREAEVAVTRELVAKSDQVIALGGGTLMQPAAREAVEGAEGAVRIYLSCDPEELYRRIAGDAASAASRPHLTSLGGGVEEIQAVLAQREPVYRAVADKVFDVTHVEPTAGVRHLINKCL